MIVEDYKMKPTRTILRSVNNMKSWTRAATENLVMSMQQVDVVEPNEPYPDFIKRKLDPYYTFRTSYLRQELRQVCLMLQPDSAVIDFIQNTPKRGYIKSAACYVAKFFFSKTDALGMFGFGQMHVLSREHAQQLIQYVRKDQKEQYHALLDVGAGCGTIADSLRPLFDNITATETSPPMATSLRERGYTCIEIDDPANDNTIMSTQFDVITCLNVMDRCSKPISMLRSLKKILVNSGPDSVLLLAVVFPFSPYVESGTTVLNPEEMIDLKLGSRPSWEDSVNAFKERVLDHVGLTVRAVTKVPYISEGDYKKDWYTITDAIFVLQGNIDF
jgi:hypothetical protein